MEMQSEKTARNKSSLRSTFDRESCKSEDIPRIYTITNNNDGRRKKQCYDRDENFIKQYEELKVNHEYKLNFNIDVNDLYSKKAEFTHSVHSFYNYIEPQYFTGLKNKDNFATDCTIATPNRVLNKNINTKTSFVMPKSNPNNTFRQTGLTSRQKLYTDKSTYCRPVTSLYNEEFIFKTMERNSKLKRLVRRLAIARQQERNNVNWNNFINDLKNRQRTDYKNSQRTFRHQDEYEQYISPDILDDYYNTKFSCEQSKLCKNLLQDFYEKYPIPIQSSYYTDRQTQGRKAQSYMSHYSLPYFTDSHCYPTASQGKLTMLERERRHKYFNQRHNRMSNDSLRYENNYIHKNYYERDSCEKKNSKNVFPVHNKYFPKKIIESTTTQTESCLSVNNFKFTRQYKATDKIEDANEIEKAAENVQDTNIKSVSLAAIENKLEILIDCVNTFIDEIKSNKKSKSKTKAASVTCEINNKRNYENNQVNFDTVDKAETPWKNKLHRGDIINDSSKSIVSTSHFYPCTVPRASEIEDILNEIDQSSPKDKLFDSRPCSYRITFEVPTKDCSTEVTKSLSKQNAGDKAEIIEEISTSKHTPQQQMTIAVNTDPFNFLSLLRISTEALMRFLSHVPNINYHSYLSMLPFPRITTKVESSFICNICGAAFVKPSTLSDHIQNHCLGKTKDCCVCRHVLDLRSRLPRLFKCKYCWQRFTRAYCCELHQRDCAERLGLPHDVASSLMLLR